MTDWTKIKTHVQFIRIYLFKQTFPPFCARSNTITLEFKAEVKIGHPIKIVTLKLNSLQWSRLMQPVEMFTTSHQLNNNWQLPMHKWNCLIQYNLKSVFVLFLLPSWRTEVEIYTSLLLFHFVYLTKRDWIQRNPRNYAHLSR